MLKGEMTAPTTCFRLGLALACLLPAGARSAAQERNRGAIHARCTPDSVQISLSPVVRVGNPIAYCLERAGPGSLIELSPGTYRGFSIGVQGASPDNARTAGGSPGLPVVIEGHGARLRPVASDTIFVSQQNKNGHILFRNLRIDAGTRSAIMFAGGGVHEGFSFHDCDILGGYQHASGGGRASRWGVHAHSLKDFEFRGVSRYAKVVNLRDEHGFYLHNLRGDVTIERVVGANLGRTFVQVTARSGEGQPGLGRVTIRDCRVRDCGIAPRDGFKGGFAFTFAGRHRGEILLERCQYRAGLNPALAHLRAPGEPYGTGALVVTRGRESEPLSRLVVRDCDFVFAPGSGDRPVVQIESAGEVRLEGRNRFLAGAYGVAIRIGKGEIGEPVTETGPRTLYVSPFTQVRGRVERLGKRIDLSDL